MRTTKRAALAVAALAALVIPSLVLRAHAAAFSASRAQEAAGQSSVVRKVGAIRAINGSTLTLTPDAGPEVNVAVQDNAHIVRVAPGEKTLKNAVAIALQDLQVGDRVLVGGMASSDGNSVLASSIVVMKRSDVEARQAQERQDWQKRGLGGLVSKVDADAGTVTISLNGFGGPKEVAIHASKATVIRRYAADSVRFEDAKPSTLAEIRPGDQLRARGDRNPDGSELTAEEIVFGTFRNVAGTVASVDASAGILSVQDLLSKKLVPVKITAESQLRQLPAPLAQRIAARFKGGAAGAPGASGAEAHAGSTGGAPGEAGMGGAPNGRGGDLQQMLSRLPAVTLANLQKGDAVMVVSTQGAAAGSGTAITLLSGVDAILRAAPEASQAMLAPWSLGAPAGDAGSQ